MSKRICCKNCVYKEPCMLCEDYSEFFDVRNLEADVSSLEVKFLGSLPVLGQTVSGVSSRNSYRFARDYRDR